MNPSLRGAPAARTPRRVPFDREHVEHFAAVDRRRDLLSGDVHPSTDVFFVDDPISAHDINRVQRLFTVRRGIRLCGVAGHRCDQALCAPCSKDRAREHRRTVLSALSVSNVGTAVLWTATVGSTPGQPLRAVWDDLDAVLKETLKGAWLTRQIDGYARAMEVERPAGGWHPHAHTLLIFKKHLTPTEARTFAHRLARRYLTAAERLGVNASSRGQSVVRWNPAQVATAARYITKSHMLTSPAKTTTTPAMVLRDLARGDADALHLYIELEAGTYRRRVWQVGGSLSPAHTS